MRKPVENFFKGVQIPPPKGVQIPPPFCERCTNSPPKGVQIPPPLFAKGVQIPPPLFAKGVHKNLTLYTFQI